MGRVRAFPNATCQCFCIGAGLNRFFLRWHASAPDFGSTELPVVRNSEDKVNRYVGKVALVSGGMGGFGLAIAERLAEEGCHVILGDITVDERSDIKHQMVNREHMLLDVTSPGSWDDVTSDIVSRYGSLDVVVNNAGVTSQRRESIDEVTPEEFRRVCSVNLDGTFFGIQAALRAMKRSPSGGSIVNIGSIASYIGIDFNDCYSAGKSAVRGLTRQAALSAARLGYNVRINVVHPGYVWTPLIARKLAQVHGNEEKAMTYVRSLNPMGKLVEPKDVASAVAFLGSDDARMITGAELLVDAGHVTQ
jgi:3(or 17)beta-hydroxysteroid dehydrogenase